MKKSFWMVHFIRFWNLKQKESRTLPFLRNHDLIVAIISRNFKTLLQTVMKVAVCIFV